MPRLLWRRIVETDLQVLRGVTKGQYDIRLGRTLDIDGFLSGLPRVPNDLGGYDVRVRLEPAPGVPAAEIVFAYIGGQSDRRDWRINRQHGQHAYALWREGTGVLATTQPGDDYAVILRDDDGKFHARWLRKGDLGRLGFAVRAAFAVSRNADLIELTGGEWHALAGRVGARYRREDENAPRKPAKPFDVDPDVVDRGTRAHKRTQNAFADRLTADGLEPLSPDSGDPPFDIAWVDHDALFVGEVKSLTDANEEEQLRLALGQVLRYAQRLRAGGRNVVPVIIVEREPSDPTWFALCASLGVQLCWL